MTRTTVRLSMLLLVAALAGRSASAEVFVLTLSNGNTVETARQPELASWDSNTILVLTEVGNWMGVPKSLVKSIDSRDQVRGFGRRIDSGTVALGESPNDLPEPGKGGGVNDRIAAALERSASQADADSKYSVQQGVSTDGAQGIPLRALGFGSFPIDPGPGRFVEGQERIDSPNYNQ